MIKKNYCIHDMTRTLVVEGDLGTMDKEGSTHHKGSGKKIENEASRVMIPGIKMKVMIGGIETLEIRTIPEEI